MSGVRDEKRNSYVSRVGRMVATSGTERIATDSNAKSERGVFRMEIRTETDHQQFGVDCARMGNSEKT